MSNYIDRTICVDIVDKHIVLKLDEEYTEEDKNTVLDIRSIYDDIVDAHFEHGSSLDLEFYESCIVDWIGFDMYYARTRDLHEQKYFLEIYVDKNVKIETFEDIFNIVKEHYNEINKTEL